MSLRTLACLLLLALAASAFAQTSSNRAALAAFLGHWEGSGKFADTKFSKAQTVTSTTDCAWTPQGSALVCETMVHDAQGDHRQLSVDTPDSEGSGFTYYTISPGRKPFYGDLAITGNTWIYGPAPDAKGHYPEFRTTNQFKGDTETFKTEFTEDGTHWTTMLEGSLHCTKR